MGGPKRINSRIVDLDINIPVSKFDRSSRDFTGTRSILESDEMKSAWLPDEQMARAMEHQPALLPAYWFSSGAPSPFSTPSTVGTMLGIRQDLMPQTTLP